MKRYERCALLCSCLEKSTRWRTSVFYSWTLLKTQVICSNRKCSLPNLFCRVCGSKNLSGLSAASVIILYQVGQCSHLGYFCQIDYKLLRHSFQSVHCQNLCVFSEKNTVSPSKESLWGKITGYDMHLFSQIQDNSILWKEQMATLVVSDCSLFWMSHCSRCWWLPFEED